MSDDSIPTSLRDITVDWLAHVLTVPDDGPPPLAGAKVERLEADLGFLDDAARIRLRYLDGDPQGWPESLIVKLPALDPPARKLGLALDAWQREHAFYVDAVARYPGLPALDCFYAAADVEQRRWCLVLSDLPGRPADLSAGATKPQLEAAVDLLAIIQARPWREGARPAWLPGFHDRAWLERVRDRWVDAIPRFVARYELLLPDGAERWVTALARGLPEWAARIADGPLTLAHGDYRIDRIRVEENRGAVTDWHNVLWGPGTIDLASVLSTSAGIGDRRGWETDLLRRYGASLESLGVEVDEAWIEQSYDESLLFCIARMAAQLADLEPGSPERHALTAAVIRRSFSAAADRDVDRFVG
jgi:hypothetical protein